MDVLSKDAIGERFGGALGDLVKRAGGLAKDHPFLAKVGSALATRAAAKETGAGEVGADVAAMAAWSMAGSETEAAAKGGDTSPMKAAPKAALLIGTLVAEFLTSKAAESLGLGSLATKALELAIPYLAYREYSAEKEGKEGPVTALLGQAKKAFAAQER